MIHPMLKKLAEEVEEKKPDESASEDKNSEKKSGEEPKEEESNEEKGETEEQQTSPAGSVDPIVLMDFLASSDAIDDAAFHSFAEQNGYDVHAAEAMAYDLAKRFVSLLRGGKSAGMDIGSVDPQQLEMGLQIEKEHTDCPCLQKKIALDHLAENPEYYSQDVFQKELQKEQGGDQQQPPAEGEKQAAMRGQGSCGGKRKFDGSGKGIGKLNMTKTAKKNLAPFLITLAKQLRKQSPSIAKKNIANVTRALKNPKAPIGK